MQRIIVYHFELYDIESDSMKLNLRPATSEAIARCKGVLLQDTAQEVDAARLDGNGFLVTQREEKA